MEDDILDTDEDDIVVKETQNDQFSPATFSRKLIQRFGICQHRHGPEAIENNLNENKEQGKYVYFVIRIILKSCTCALALQFNKCMCALCVKAFKKTLSYSC